MNYIPHVIGIVLILGLVFYFVWIHDGDINSAYNNAEQIALDNIGKIRTMNDAGDVAEIFKGKPTVVQETVFINQNTGKEVSKDEFIQTVNQTGTVTEEDLIQMYVTGGESYGYTAQFKNKELPDNHYQISNPVQFNGKLMKVIEGSCMLNPDTNNVECDYITPATFSYTFTVSCEYRDFCSLTDIFRYGQKTQNDGSWNQLIQTNPSDFTVGEYVMKIEANSEVINPVTLRPYIIIAEKKFNMVE